MILIAVNSLHRDNLCYMEMKGDVMLILPCDV